LLPVKERLEEQLKRLPAKPGVYIFRDERSQVLYVGKAKSLRPRVRSYFQASADVRHAIAQLPERVDDIEVIVTGSEVEALHLEQNLVKRHRPPFNVRLRDDKSFPYIAVTVEDDFPRVMFTRERHRRGVTYFGPYANAKKVRETLDVLNRVFQYRPCEGPKPGRHSGIPCLDYHIERCHAPCVDYISRRPTPRSSTGSSTFSPATRARSSASSKGRCTPPQRPSASRRRRATGTGSSRFAG
jgi:excinuclease ABC subunit C